MEDPHLAESTAKRLFEGGALDRALYTVSSIMARTDPDQAVALSKEIRNAALKGGVVSSAVLNAMQEDRKAGLTFLGGLDDASVVAALSYGHRSDESLLANLSRSDPGMLIELLDRFSITSSNENIFRSAAQKLALSSPDQVDALISSIPSSPFKNQMTADQFTIYAKQDPASAIERASNLGDSQLQASALRSIGEVLGSTQSMDVERVAEIVDRLKTDQSAIVVGAAIVNISKNRPDAAADFLLTDGDTILEPDRSGVFSAVGASLVANDATRVENWLNQLSANDKQLAMQGVADQMAKTRIEDLPALLSTIPRDESWAVGVKVLIKNIRNSDPETASKWAEHLKSSGFE